MARLTKKETEKVQVCIEQATLAIRRYGYTVSAIVTASKLAPNQRKKSFGFKFDSTKLIGDKWTDEYGVFHEVVAIVAP